MRLLSFVSDRSFRRCNDRAHEHGIQEQLMAVRNIAEPLRLRLDIPPMQHHLDELQTLELLPQPLHTAFLQLRAAQEAFGLPADISISGKQRRPPGS